MTIKPIYLDYAATTPVDPRVVATMLAYLSFDGEFGNPSSSHAYGKSAKEAVELARAQVADLIHAEPGEIIWTSGATEANNLALKGMAALYQGKGRHIVTFKTEHSAVLDCCQELEKQGFYVTYLAPNANGLIDWEVFLSAIREDTIAVSMMHVNNELGVVQDIQKMAEFTASRGILFHMDAAQSAGKILIDVTKTPVDLISFSAHKIYGPKGVGALYLRKKPRVRVAAQIHGGGHEQGMRSGTLPTHQIAGMGEAFAIAGQTMQQDYQRILLLRERFLKPLLGTAKFRVNGCLAHSYPGIINLHVASTKANRLMHDLPELAFSAASACHAKGDEPSYVLRALGQTRAEAECGVRFSFGRFTTEKEIDTASRLLLTVVDKPS